MNGVINQVFGHLAELAAKVLTHRPCPMLAEEISIDPTQGDGTSPGPFGPGHQGRISHYLRQFRLSAHPVRGAARPLVDGALA
ncbi:MAG TPA: hypothetical protein VHW44_32085 [Pseudonocardiaceae bacterium]|jgi:hypothetical protein|nr:hypothetical protein [Pseudonocardiaceae bacterium]